MGAADMSVWRRQNSDVVQVEMQLVDGTLLKGAVLLSRDKTLRDFFNIAADPFFDFECKHEGNIIVAKSSVRKIRPDDPKKKDDQAKVDALAARLVELEKTDPYKLLGVPTNVGHDELRKAYIGKARAYHPDRFTDVELPAEVLEYLNAMARRVNTAYEDLGDVLERASKLKK